MRLSGRTNGHITERKGVHKSRGQKVQKLPFLFIIVTEKLRKEKLDEDGYDKAHKKLAG